MTNFFEDSALFKNKTKPLFYPQICRLSSSGNVSPFISQNSQAHQEEDLQASQTLKFSLMKRPNALSNIDNELVNVKMSTPKDKGKIVYKKHFKDFILNYNVCGEDEDEQDSDHYSEYSSLMSDCSSEITNETSVAKNDKVGSSVINDLQDKKLREDEDEGDDDIEIIDVREIYCANKHDQKNENKIYRCSNNSSNGDVIDHNINNNNENDDLSETGDINRGLFSKNILIDLNPSKTNEISYGEADKASMEYLLNAISLLTKNKRDLEHKLKESEIVTNQLNQKLCKNSEVVNILKHNVKKLQESLKISINELQLFKNRLYSTRGMGDEVNMELKSLKEHTLENNETINFLKDCIVGLKDKMAANNINNAQKSTQIQHLKSKLDDVSGRLSEEKITNSSLIKTIEETRNTYETELYKSSVKQQQLLEKILDKDNELTIKWEAFTGSLNDFRKANVENLNCLKLELIETASSIDVKSYSKILSLFDETNRHLKVLSTNDKYINISHQINDLIENIKSKDALESQFKAKNNELIQEKTVLEGEYHSALDNYDKQKHQITEISAKVGLTEELKSRALEENNSLRYELNLAKKEFSIAIDKLKTERQDLIKSFEGKLKTQNELMKHAEEENSKLLDIEKQKNESLVSKLHDKVVLIDKLKKIYEEPQEILEKSTEITESSTMELRNLRHFVDKEMKDSSGPKNQVNFTSPKLDLVTKEKKDLKFITQKNDKTVTGITTELNIEREYLTSSEKESSNLNALTTEKKLENIVDSPSEIQLLRSSTLNILNKADKTLHRSPIVSDVSKMLRKKIPKKRKLIESQDNTKSSQSLKQNKIVGESQPKFSLKTSHAEVFEIPDIFSEFEAIDKLKPPRLNTIIKK